MRTLTFCCTSYIPTGNHILLLPLVAAMLRIPACCMLHVGSCRCCRCCRCPSDILATSLRHPCDILAIPSRHPYEDDRLFLLWRTGMCLSCLGSAVVPYRLIPCAFIVHACVRASDVS